METVLVKLIGDFPSLAVAIMCLWMLYKIIQEHFKGVRDEVSVLKDRVGNIETNLTSLTNSVQIMAQSISQLVGKMMERDKRDE